MIIQAPNNIAKGSQSKQKHHHQEMVIIPINFNMHNKAVINRGQPPKLIVNLLIF